MNRKNISSLSALAVLAAASTAYAAAGRDLSVNARNALGELQGGLGGGVSLEESSQAGFKAEQALMGLAQKGESALVDASNAGGADAAAESAVGRRGSLTVSDVPAPSNKPAPEKPGFFERVKNKALDVVLNAKAHYDKWGKGKRIAFLGALLAAEVATLVYPTTAITVVFMGIGALGIIGTTRELIAAIRRGDQ